MASVRNPYRHDPALREGLNSLAALFAPPSGAELAGFATANARRQEAERIADLYARAGNANLTPEQMTALDQQMAVQAGGWQNSRWRFGQDDRRARDMNAADNTRALQQTQMQQAGETTRTMLAPVAQGATRFVPPSIAQMYGVPGTQTGVVETKPGERATLPDGRVIEGPPKPMSLDESKAQVFQQMPPEQQRAMTFGSTPIEQIILNGRPTNVTRPDAIGQSPVPAANTAARKDGMALLPDGRRVPVTRDPAGLQWQTQDGAPIPPEAQVFDLARPQGTNEQLGITSSNVTEANRMRAAVSNADGIIRDIDTLVRNNPAATGLAANVISFTQDLRQVLAEFGQKFGGSPNADAPVTAQQLQTMASGLLDRVAPNQAYNPVYRQARALLLELAYSNARMNNPSGEVSRFALERELEQLGLGTVGNDQAVLAVLGNARNRLQRKLVEADILAGRQQGPTPSTLSQPGGAPAAAPAPAAPAPAAPQGRIRFDANGNIVQ